MHIALRRLSFSLTILERCNTPYLAWSKGGAGGLGEQPKVADIQKVYSEEYAKCTLEYTKCRERYAKCTKNLHKIQNLYQKGIDNGIKQSDYALISSRGDSISAPWGGENNVNFFKE